MHKFIDVLLPIAVDRPFTYAIENDQSKLIEPGFRVAVSFGKSKIYTGVVLKIHNIPPQGYDAKFIELVLDKQKSITKKQLDFWLWISEYYHSKMGEILRAALPSTLLIESETIIVKKEISDEKKNKCQMRSF